MNIENQVLKMLLENEGLMGLRLLHGTFYNMGVDHKDLRQAIDNLTANGLIRHEDRMGYELGVYLLTEVGALACQPMSG